MNPNYMDLLRSTQLSTITPRMGYYRQANGWITVAVTTELEELNYRREGWEPLPQYGRFDMTAEYAANHPLELLLMRGGAKELSLDQILSSGFHLNPPVIPACGLALTQYHQSHRPNCWVNAQPVHFPQLNGQIYPGFQCHFCERPQFPTEKARDQHEGVMHKDEQGDIRTGQVLADALIKGLVSKPPVSADRQDVSIEALRVLADTGLTRKQLEALRAAGIAIPAEEPDAEVS